MGISERRACRAIGQPRSTQGHERKVLDDEERLVSQIVRLATQYGRYGCRRITALLRNDGWRVNHKRVERIWRQEGLALQVARRIRSGDVLDQLYELFLRRGLPDCIRSDNGPEFAAKAVRKWPNRLDVTTLFIEPGSPWENGSIESFIGKLRDELLNGEVLDTLDEAKVLVEAWRKAYNHIRPHSSLEYRPPAPEAMMAGKFTLGLVQC